MQEEREKGVKRGETFAKQDIPAVIKNADIFKNFFNCEVIKEMKFVNGLEEKRIAA